MFRKQHVETTIRFWWICCSFIQLWVDNERAFVSPLSRLYLTTSCLLFVWVVFCFFKFENSWSCHSSFCRRRKKTNVNDKVSPKTWLSSSPHIGSVERRVALPSVWPTKKAKEREIRWVFVLVAKRLVWEDFERRNRQACLCVYSFFFWFFSLRPDVCVLFLLFNHSLISMARTMTSKKHMRKTSPWDIEQHKNKNIETRRVGMKIVLSFSLMIETISGFFLSFLRVHLSTRFSLNVTFQCLNPANTVIHPPMIMIVVMLFANLWRKFKSRLPSIEIKLNLDCFAFVYSASCLLQFIASLGNVMLEIIDLQRFKLHSFFFLLSSPQCRFLHILYMPSKIEVAACRRNVSHNLLTTMIHNTFSKKLCTLIWFDCKNKKWNWFCDRCEFISEALSVASNARLTRFLMKKFIVEIHRRKCLIKDSIATFYGNKLSNRLTSAWLRLLCGRFWDTAKSLFYNFLHCFSPKSDTSRWNRAYSSQQFFMLNFSFRILPRHVENKVNFLHLCWLSCELNVMLWECVQYFYSKK